LIFLRAVYPIIRGDSKLYADLLSQSSEAVGLAQGYCSTIACDIATFKGHVGMFYNESLG
jgi:hypothetical protein